MHEPAKMRRWCRPHILPGNQEAISEAHELILAVLCFIVTQNHDDSVDVI